LLGVELRPRPQGLAPRIGWRTKLPAGHAGLVLANEVLDNIACDVAQLDPDGRPRLIELHRVTGEERLGPPVDAEQASWLATWWPLTGQSDRAEIGLTRDALWA